MISTLVVQEFLCNGLDKKQDRMVLFGAVQCVIKRA